MSREDHNAAVDRIEAHSPLHCPNCKTYFYWPAEKGLSVGDLCNYCGGAELEDPDDE